MWLLKIILPLNDQMLIQSRAKKHKVRITGYPLNRVWKGKKFMILASAFLEGSELAKKSFMRELRKDSRTVRIEMTTSDFGFWLVEQNPIVADFYDPMIIHASPARINEGGETLLEVASWDRKKLASIIRYVGKHLPGTKIVSFRQEKIRNIGIVTAIPEMTKKQKLAISLAVEYGYYGYPRKANIERLAKMMKVSYSTFQFHLRNAEKKLFPAILSN